MPRWSPSLAMERQPHGGVVQPPRATVIRARSASPHRVGSSIAVQLSEPGLLTSQNDCWRQKSPVFPCNQPFAPTGRHESRSAAADDAYPPQGRATPHRVGGSPALEVRLRAGFDDALAAHEADVLAYGIHALAEIPGLRLIGTAHAKASVLSFMLDGIHPHDIATILDREGIAIRAGHHCAQPLMKRLGVAATARASLACYSTRQDIDALVAGLRKVQEVFR